MDRRPLDEIYGMFVTFETVIPNPNKNKFSAKFPTKIHKNRRKNVRMGRFQPKHGI